MNYFAIAAIFMVSIFIGCESFVPEHSHPLAEHTHADTGHAHPLEEHTHQVEGHTHVDQGDARRNQIYSQLMDTLIESIETGDWRDYEDKVVTIRGTVKRIGHIRFSTGFFRKGPVIELKTGKEWREFYIYAFRLNDRFPEVDELYVVGGTYNFTVLVKEVRSATLKTIMLTPEEKDDVFQVAAKVLRGN